MSCVTITAQNLTQQMLQLYCGQIMTLVQRNEGMSGEAKTQFDRNGRVLSYEEPGGKLEYSWSDDNSSVELRGYQNGQYQGTQMLYISEMSTSRYEYTVAGVSYNIDFNSVGSISKQKMSANGQTQTSFFYYRTREDRLPYKIVMSMGGQSMSIAVEVLERDSYGNPIRVSQTANGETMITVNEITYY